jgi:DNA-binding transcriptional regulator YhcF (GntR family)
MYLYTNQLADRGVKHLEKKNIVYTKDGLKVGVKEVKDEDLNDKSQR